MKITKILSLFFIIYFITLSITNYCLASEPCWVGENQDYATFHDALADKTCSVINLIEGNYPSYSPFVIQLSQPTLEINCARLADGSTGEMTYDTPSEWKPSATTIAIAEEGYPIMEITSLDTAMQHTVHISNCILTGARNISGSVDGGAIDVSGANIRLILNNVYLHHNNGRFGGGIHIYGASVTIKNSKISKNTATNFGGGIDVLSGDVKIENTVIEENSVPEKGGAVMLRGFSTATINRSTLIKNKARYHGAISVSSGKLTAINSTFAENTAIEGSAIYVGSRSNATLYHVMVINNTKPADSNLTASNIAAMTVGGKLRIANSILSNYLNCELKWDGSIGSYGGNLEVRPSCNLTKFYDQAVFIYQINLEKRMKGIHTYFVPIEGQNYVIDQGFEQLCQRVDQLGQGRPNDGNGDGTANCDKGSYENPRPYLKMTPKIQPYFFKR